MLADAEQIFRSGVQVFDKKTLIDNDDGRVQVFENMAALRRITALPGFFSGGLFAG